MKNLLLTVLVSIFLLTTSAFSADYTVSKKIDGLDDVSAAVTKATLVPVQDMDDTDRFGSASIEDIVNKGLEAPGAIGGDTPGASAFTTISVSDAVTLSDGAVIDQSANTYVELTENSDFFRWLFGGTDIDLIWSDGVLNLRNAEDSVDAIVEIEGKDDGEKGILRVLSDGDDKYVEIYHDDTDSVINSSSGKIKCLDPVESTDTLYLSDGLTIDQSADNYLDVTENSDYFKFYFGGTDIDFIWSDGVFNIRNAEDGVDAIVEIEGKDDGEKGVLRVLSDGDDKYVEIYHDDTDTIINSSSGNIKCIDPVQMGTTRFYSAVVTLSTAQINALRATPITLVAAQGANTVIEFVSAVITYDYATAAFTVGADEDLVIQYHDGTDASASIETTGFLDQTDDEIRFVPAAIAVNTDLEASINQALEIFNTGTGETTDGGGEVDVRVTYRVYSTGF